jgi:acetylornithine/succinyldiaminopimelate/putrescine aminotransferase/predicted amino acid dehydrogenase
MTTEARAREILEQALRTRAATAAGSPRDLYQRHVNPDLGVLLRALSLDQAYVRGEGTVLVDDVGRKVLDFAGAYGALPFGHNPPEVWQAIEGVRASSEPAFTQPSSLAAAGTLAKKLVLLAPAGLDRVTFASTGAEVVEVALKIARSATGRLGILSTDNGFHGKTLGALSATGRLAYQQGFGAPAGDFSRVPFGDAEAVAAAFAARPGEYAALIVEPIQGEGGVRVPPVDYLRSLRQLCDLHGVLLIVDEVQTGLGRTGALFACDKAEISPDILTIAKALGGGVLPVGAVLSRAAVTSEDFLLRHTSTFAGNAPGARVGLAVLDALTRDDRALVRRVARLGERLKADLQALQDEYPSVITEVRGDGLLLGVEFSADLNLVGEQGLMGALAAQENLTAALCSYLLNVEGVRVAPTLFGARVLRVEPPLTVTDEECDIFLAALGRAVEHVERNDIPALLGHLVEHVAAPSVPRQRTGSQRPPLICSEEGDRRFGFIVHPLDDEGVLDFDPTLAPLSVPQRRRLLARLAGASSSLSPAPFVVGSVRLSAASGTSAYGELVGVPYTAAQLLALPSRDACHLIDQAVRLAAARGAEIVGLGAYSSIVTSNAQALDPPVPVTTGNGFTAAATVEALLCAADERGLDLRESTLAVLGARGAIGRACAVELSQYVGRLILVGRSTRGDIRSSLGEVAEACVRNMVTGRPIEAHSTRSLVELFESEGRLLLTDDARGAARRADLVVCATSTPEPLIDVHDLRQDAIVCDVAQPGNVDPAGVHERSDVLLFDGGIVRLPHDQGLGLRYGLPEGLTFACMAETMLLALAGDSAARSIGSTLSEEGVRRLRHLARDHGFSLASPNLWRNASGTSPAHPVEVR